MLEQLGKSVACIEEWKDPAGKEPDLLSFAAITDDPEPEVAAAGHDRTIINIKPTQKEGSEKPNMEPAMMERDAGCSGFRPAYKPSGSPITMAMSRATSASSIVAGIRLRIKAMAGSPCTKD